jgi:hypothetical protein
VEASATRYEALLGRPVDARREGPEGRRVHIEVQDATITLIEPGAAGGPVLEHVARRGDGPHSLVLIGDADRDHLHLPASIAHGARLEIRPVARAA